MGRGTARKDMAPATSEGTCTVEYQGNRNRCLVSSLGSSCRLPTRTPDLPVACFCHSPGPPRRRGSIVPCVRGLRRLRPRTLPVAIVRKKPHDRPAQAQTVLLLLCNVVAGIGCRVTNSVIRAVSVHSTSVQGGGWPCLAQCVTHMPEWGLAPPKETQSTVCARLPCKKRRNCR
jgi:hypothetical protein